MPDLTPLWNIGFGLVIYLVLIRIIFGDKEEFDLHKLSSWVYVAAVAFGFLMALVALLVIAKSLGL